MGVQLTSNNYYSGSKFLIGSIDLKFDCRDFRGFSFNVFVEVKTSIPSVGELLRQLNTYKEFLNSSGNAFIVVAPDNSQERILKEQGYLFYKYEDPTKLF